jgi:hypothetical protein
MLNPKNYHIELRKNTGLQEVLLEDDIFAATEDAAIEYLQAWARCYIEIQDEEAPIVIGCRNNWTGEAVYMQIFGYWRYTLRFGFAKQARNALNQIFEMGWQRGDDFLYLDTDTEIAEETWNSLQSKFQPINSFDTFILKPFGD